MYTCCMHFSNSRAPVEPVEASCCLRVRSNVLMRSQSPTKSLIGNSRLTIIGYIYKAEVLYQLLFASLRHSFFTPPLLHSETEPVVCASIDHTLTHSHTHHIIVYADSLSHSFTADSPQHTCSCIIDIEVLRENTHTRIEAHCKGYGIIRPLQGHRLVRGCGLHHGQGEHKHIHIHIHTHINTPYSKPNNTSLCRCSTMNS